MSRERPTVVARVRDSNPETLAVVAVGAVAGALVFFLAHHLFPYHSLNHDEGVYLQQAAMLLDGNLWLEPPVPDAVRPWFFVHDGPRLYPKYQPVTAALFAPALALGVPRVTLAVVAAGSTVLVGLLAREAFDGRTGAVAAALVVTAPLFLLTSSVFLSYAPTTFLNLLFALAYVRAHRRESLRYATLAGVAVGLAVFSRPYTAFLFALPFVAHAAATLALPWYRLRFGDAGTTLARAKAVSARLVVVGSLGTAFVALTLAYNWLVTGDPLVFPYQAFAPEDGIGFGHREILNHERDYTPALALRANGRVLWQFLTRWGPLGPLGSFLAAVGVGTALLAPLARNVRERDAPESADGPVGSDLSVRVLLAGVAVTVTAGNVLFWGNLNVLAALDDPTDGLIAFLGPFYHFDLLVPVAAFGAAGIVTLAERTWTVAGRLDRPDARRGVFAVAVLVSLALAGGVVAGALADPVDRNAAYRDDVESVYAPFEQSPPTDALVFVPTPYGDWLNHPFQWLRNDPSFDGERVYVLNRGPAGDAASLAAFPDRDPYRFTYRGQWPPGEEGVTPVLEPLSVRTGERLVVETRMGVPVGAESASVRLAAAGDTVQYGLERVDGELTTLRWAVGPDGARPLSDGLTQYSDDGTVPVGGPTRVTMSVTFTQPGGSTVTYRQELTVLEADERVRALWPPEGRVCVLTTACGHDGTYVSDGDYPTGVSLSSAVENGSVAGDAP